LGFGAVLAVGAGSAAAADDFGSDDVVVTVDVPEIEEPGVLALTVATDSAALVEAGSDELERHFVGTLPTVTVTDTRSPDEVAEGAYWYVLGTAGEFVPEASTSPAIAAENFGWQPSLVAGEGEAFVSVGDSVDTALEGGVGLVDQELLFLADSGPALAQAGSWSASADLFLHVPATVTPGAYASVLTLSLFE
jgi:hypothetical protein